MEQILIGMSGGVDSSVAAALLCRQGHRVTGATLQLYREDPASRETDLTDARAVCRAIGADFITADLSSVFRQKVVEPFIRAYLDGLTPNPCLLCNRQVKFAALLELARGKGIDTIATGHYARLSPDGNGRMLLYRPADRQKDQTYVLYDLPQEILLHTRMPLASYSKEQIREMAVSLGLDNADRKDSQDICFVPDGDYAAFIRRYTQEAFTPGDYVDETGRILGRHKGVACYTIGQRKGLGVAFGHPMFVCEKRPASNQVVLTTEDRLYSRDVYLKQCNFIPFDTFDGTLSVTAKLRYRHAEEKAQLSMVDETTAYLRFENPQRAPTPGQAAVIYDGDLVIGGGIIQ